MATSFQTVYFLKRERERKEISTSFKKDSFLPKALDETTHTLLSRLIFMRCAARTVSVFYMQIRNTMVESVGGGWPAARERGRRRRKKEGGKGGAGRCRCASVKISSGPCVIYIASGIKPGNEWRSYAQQARKLA